MFDVSNVIGAVVLLVVLTFSVVLCALAAHSGCLPLCAVIAAMGVAAAGLVIAA